MARAPDSRIEQAEAMYRKGIKLVEIASQLNLPEGTVRRWKCTHKWDSDVRIEIANVRLKIGEHLKVIKMLLTTALQNRIRTQKNTVSSASTCLRRPFPLSRRCPRTRWTSYGTRCR